MVVENHQAVLIKNLRSGLEFLKRIKDDYIAQQERNQGISPLRRLEEPNLVLHIWLDRRIQLLMHISEERDRSTMRRIALPIYKTVAVDRGSLTLIEQEITLLPLDTANINAFLALLKSLTKPSSSSIEEFHGAKASSPVTLLLESLFSSSFYRSRLWTSSLRCRIVAELSCYSTDYRILKGVVQLCREYAAKHSPILMIDVELCRAKQTLFEDLLNREQGTTEATADRDSDFTIYPVSISKSTTCQLAWMVMNELYPQQIEIENDPLPYIASLPVDGIQTSLIRIQEKRIAA